MSAARSSAHFRFYWERFLADTAPLTRRQRADYALLLVHLHAAGTDRMTAFAARRLLGLDGARWTRLLAALVEADCVSADGDGGLAQADVGRELAARRRLTEARRRAGKALGVARQRRAGAASTPSAGQTSGAGARP